MANNCTSEKSRTNGIRNFAAICMTAALTLIVLARHAGAAVAVDVTADGALRIVGDHEHDDVHVTAFGGTIFVNVAGAPPNEVPQVGINRISANLGGGNDEVSLLLFFDGDIDVDFGSFAAEGLEGFAEQFKVSGVIGGDLSVTSAGPCHVIQQHTSVGGDFVIRTGPQHDLIDFEAGTFFNSLFVAGDLVIDTGPGADRALLFSFPLGSFDVGGSVYIDLGTGGNRDVLELCCFSVGANLAILSDQGPDGMRIAFSSVAGDALLLTGEGKDRVELQGGGLEADGLLFLDGGNGMDTLDLNGRILDPSEYANFETVIE